MQACLACSIFQGDFVIHPSLSFPPLHLHMASSSQPESCLEQQRPLPHSHIAHCPSNLHKGEPSNRTLVQRAQFVWVATRKSSDKDSVFNQQYTAERDSLKSHQCLENSLPENSLNSFLIFKIMTQLHNVHKFPTFFSIFMASHYCWFLRKQVLSYKVTETVKDDATILARRLFGASLACFGFSEGKVGSLELDMGYLPL